MFVFSHINLHKFSIFMFYAAKDSFSVYSVASVWHYSSLYACSYKDNAYKESETVSYCQGKLVYTI